MLADRESVVEDLLAPGEGYFVELIRRLEGTEQFNLRAHLRRGSGACGGGAGESRTSPSSGAAPGSFPKAPCTPTSSAWARRSRLHSTTSAWRTRTGSSASVGPQVLEIRERPGAGVDRVFDVALLVERTRREELEDVLEGLAEAVHERIRLSLTGPLPPYDFVGEGQWG